MNLCVNPAQNVSARAAGIVRRARPFVVLALLGAGVSGCGYNTIPTLEE
jgi:hypothetical protein